VFISDNAIEDIVTYKLNHPEHLFVSANIINHPKLQTVHNAFMTQFPFAPDTHPVQHPGNNWRISNLPSSPVEYVRSMNEFPVPPDYKHRWLPMRNATIDDCPIREGIDCSGRPRWECATIAHYSFFQHLENRPPLFQRVLIVDSEKTYDFGVWDFHGTAYERWSINFFAAWGHEIIAARPVPEDDEQHFSADHPARIRKRPPHADPADSRLRRDRKCAGIPLLVLLAEGGWPPHRCPGTLPRNSTRTTGRFNYV
jgi:hypothetical protein